MDWELLKKIDPTKLIGGEGASPFNLITGEKEKTKASKDIPLSGLYYRKPSLKYNPHKGLCCSIEFFESQEKSIFDISLWKSITIGTAERYFVDACKFVVKNKPQKAIAKLGEVLNKDPQYSDAYFLMGCILMEAEQFDKANSCFQKVLLCQKSLGKEFKKYLPTFHVTLNLNLPSAFCIFPELLGSTILVSVSYWENGKKEDAISALEQSESIFPKNSGVLYLMTYLKLEMAKYNDIVTQLSNFEPSNSLDLATYTLLGTALYSSYDFSVSIQTLKNALKIAERLDQEDQTKLIRYHLGRAYLNKGDKFEGLQELKKIISLDVDYLDVNAILKDPFLGSTPYTKEKIKETVQETKVIDLVEKKPVMEKKDISSKIAIQEPVIIEKISEKTKIISDHEEKAITTSAESIKIDIAPSEVLPAISSQKAILTIQNTEEKFSIKSQEFTTIGRESTNDISFPDDFSISRRQARIVLQNGEFFVEDLGSTNGTYLNKRRISKKMSLKNNDEIQMGKKIFIFMLE
ncbi:MAG TPA: FHA domain-containing protein [Candidatus Eremiobacteraeota bacterium]|nr:MAG: Glycogen accumulation regulator GarA [bacterium ADurb.Bin363]HPZ09320.1 FHA domain-containing protein [Candidatus Eremiobacteraeota bacterium]